MTKKSLTEVTAHEAHALLDRNAVLVDVRDRNEHAIEHIPGAVAWPLSEIARGSPADMPKKTATVFLCGPGVRTRRNADALAALVDDAAYRMTGGVMAWKQAGYPTEDG